MSVTHARIREENMWARDVAESTHSTMLSSQSEYALYKVSGVGDIFGGWRVFVRKFLVQYHGKYVLRAVSALLSIVLTLFMAVRVLVASHVVDARNIRDVRYIRESLSLTTLLVSAHTTVVVANRLDRGRTARHGAVGIAGVGVAPARSRVRRRGAGRNTHDGAPGHARPRRQSVSCSRHWYAYQEGIVVSVVSTIA